MPKKKQEVPQTNTPALTSADIAAASTNDPSLSPSEVSFSGKTYKLVHLPYSDYLAFITHLQPMLDGVITGIVSRAKPKSFADVAPSNFSVSSLLKYCSEQLPEMVSIALRQSDPTVTPQYVIEHAADPFELCDIVLKQVVFNQMIEKFSAFFGQILQVMNKTLKG